VAVNAVLAHAGCFVAAEFASFRLLDRIFSRLGSADDCAANTSTFMTECRELADILRHATKSSLCIIDELVRTPR
jgi:DNA mismatch repair ATPase MutS